MSARLFREELWRNNWLLQAAQYQLPPWGIVLECNWWISGEQHKAGAIMNTLKKKKKEKEGINLSFSISMKKNVSFVRWLKIWIRFCSCFMCVTLFVSHTWNNCKITALECDIKCKVKEWKKHCWRVLQEAVIQFSLLIVRNVEAFCSVGWL